MQGIHRPLLLATLFATLLPGAAIAEWKPTRPVEFVVSAGPGGGTDQFARIVQLAIQKHQLMPVSVIVSNKSGGAGSEAFVHVKTNAGDPHKVLFSTNLAYLTPMIVKAGYKAEDIRPVAIMAADEFLLWTHANAPYKTARDLIEAERAKEGALRMGGGHSKDTDHILTRQIEKATGVKLTYIPFKSGNEAAIQLAGAHIDANTNNPNENISQWKAGNLRPLCVFAPQRLSAYTDKVTANASFGDVPLCKDEGIPIEQFNMPRTVWLPSGTSDEQAQYYIGMLAKVRETPEWKEWLRTGMQSDFFLTGKKLDAYVEADMAKHRKQFAEDGWLIAE